MTVLHSEAMDSEMYAAVAAKEHRQFKNKPPVTFADHRSDQHVSLQMLAATLTYDTLKAKKPPELD